MQKVNNLKFKNILLNYTLDRVDEIIVYVNALTSWFLWYLNDGMT